MILTFVCMCAQSFTGTNQRGGGATETQISSVNQSTLFFTRPYQQTGTSRTTEGRNS